ncbi:MAG: AAC(3) family N-acetyltransferase [Clostridia bacterium]|nr:AAC(3) family N-acetyltransferase [Clostridia bacterium]
MTTKQDILRFLADMGIAHDDTVTIHAALRKVGPIEGGADGLIDALTEYLCDGLLLVPTHTWAVTDKDHPYFDVRSTVPNIGTLARVAAQRKDGIRSLHPTHSMAAFGKNARAYIEGEEKSATLPPWAAR